MNFNTIRQKIKEITPNNLKQLFKHQGFKRYFKNTGWMFFGQMFSLLVSFFIGAWIARYLGPENYGTISYTIAFVGIFGFISNLGVDSIVNRELIKYPEKTNSFMGTGFIMKLSGGLLAFLLTIVCSLYSNTSHTLNILIALYATTLFIQSYNIISIFFQARVQSKYNVQSQIFGIIISSILKIILILTGGGIYWLIIIYIFDIIWQILGYVIIYNKQGFRINQWQFDKTLAKTLIKDSWPLILSSAASYIYLRIDQVMIGQIMDIKTVGLYAAAVKISEIIYFIPAIICTSLFPAIINAKETNEELYKKRLHHLYWLMLISAFLISLLISLSAKWIINLLFGSAYYPAASILAIYTWSSIGLFLGTAINQYLMAENMTRFIFITNLIAMVINIVLNFILIPKIGMSGAAIATLVSYLIIPISAGLLIRNKKTY